jgi:hypothetical protein
MAECEFERCLVEVLLLCGSFLTPVSVFLHFFVTFSHSMHQIATFSLCTFRDSSSGGTLLVRLCLTAGVVYCLRPSPPPPEGGGTLLVRFYPQCSSAVSFIH